MTKLMVIPSNKNIDKLVEYADSFLIGLKDYSVNLGVYFELEDIEVDFLAHFKHFYGSKELRTCDNCGTVMETDKRFIK